MPLLYNEKFSFKNMVRADIFPILWQFGKNAAKPPRGLIFPRAAACGGARAKIRSSYIQNTPPVGICKGISRLAPRCGSALGCQFIFIFG